MSGWAWRVPGLSAVLYALWLADARRKADWMAPYLSAGDRLVEIGSGPGSVVDVLMGRGWSVTPVDIAAGNHPGSLQPVVYDGQHLPFGDASFDVALVLTVLHHAQNPEQVLLEARRVARRVIVIEDIFTGPWHRRMTKVADSITNFEVFGHPHNNRDDAGWRRCFKALDMHLVHSSQKPYIGAFLQALYVLEREV